MGSAKKFKFGYFVFCGVRNLISYRVEIEVLLGQQLLSILQWLQQEAIASQHKKLDLDIMCLLGKISDISSGQISGVLLGHK